MGNFDLKYRLAIFSVFDHGRGTNVDRKLYNERMLKLHVRLGRYFRRIVFVRWICFVDAGILEQNSPCVGSLG